jgi:hypothetical protein
MFVGGGGRARGVGRISQREEGGEKEEMKGSGGGTTSFQSGAGMFHEYLRKLLSNEGFCDCFRALLCEDEKEASAAVCTLVKEYGESDHWHVGGQSFNKEGDFP